MTTGEGAGTAIRLAGPADLPKIIAIAKAAGQDGDWTDAFPGYVCHLMANGSLLVAERAGAVTG